MKMLAATLFLSLFPSMTMATGWEKVSTGKSARLFGAYFQDADHGYVVGDSDRILKTSDGGSSWTSIAVGLLGPTTELNKVRFYGDTGFVVLNETWVAVSTDQGDHWKLPGPGNALRNYEFEFIDTKTIFGVGPKGSMSKTINTGATWNFPVSGTTVDLRGVDFVDASIGYAVGAEKTILKTTDGGANWAPQTTLSFSLQSVSFADADKGCAVGQAGSIVRTVDGGATWTPATTEGYTNWTTVRFATPDIAYAVGYEGSIAKTTDGGATWAIQASGTLAKLRFVFPVDANTVYAVGDSGVVLKTTDGGGTAGTSTFPSVARELKLVFDGAGMRITLAAPERITLRRLNLEGKLLSEENLELRSGINVIPFIAMKGVTVMQVRRAGELHSLLVSAL